VFENRQGLRPAWAGTPRRRARRALARPSLRRSLVRVRASEARPSLIRTAAMMARQAREASCQAKQPPVLSDEASIPLTHGEHCTCVLQYGRQSASPPVSSCRDRLATKLPPVWWFKHRDGTSACAALGKQPGAQQTCDDESLGLAV
jgi:hypothetical protein